MASPEFTIKVSPNQRSRKKKNTTLVPSVNKVKKHLCKWIYFWLGANWGEKKIAIARIPEGVTEVAAGCWRLKYVKNEVSN